MKLVNKKFLTILGIVGLSVLSIESVAQKPLGCVTTVSKGAEAEIKGVILYLTNGQTIIGKKLKYNDLGKFVKLDGQKIAWDEVHGYQKDDEYYIKYKEELILRVVSGKVSIYLYQRLDSRASSLDRNSSSQYTCFYFIQTGGDRGALVPLKTVEELRALVSSCPAAKEMMGVENKEFFKKVRKNLSHIKEMMAIFNNDCKAVASN